MNHLKYNMSFQLDLRQCQCVNSTESIHQTDVYVTALMYMFVYMTRRCSSLQLFVLSHSVDLEISGSFNWIISNKFSTSMYR